MFGGARHELKCMQGQKRQNVYSKVKGLAFGPCLVVVLVYLSY